MTRAEDDYRRQFLTDGEFDPPMQQYWVVVHDERHEDRFAYDPIIHGPLKPVLRVALVEGAVGGPGGPGEPYDLGVEETATRGARLPGINWVRHECFFTMNYGEPQKCIGSDPTCSGFFHHCHEWVAWRRVEVHYSEEFDDPDNFEEHVRHVREQANEYNRSRFKVVRKEAATGSSSRTRQRRR